MSETLSIKSLIVPSKEVEVEYPGMPDFKIKVAFLSRETLINLRKKATKTTYKGRSPQADFNEDLFLQLYCDSSIKGWEGLKVSYLEQLAPIDTYMKNPYATFSRGGRQQFPRSRDPKLLISQSIREIAASKIANQLRAVEV